MSVSYSRQIRHAARVQFDGRSRPVSKARTHVARYKQSLRPAGSARMTEQRRLAAILVADVVGYSKLVGSDEAGTLAQLQALRTEVIEPAIAKHAGRLFKAVGDGFLVEFASAVQAVEAAQAIQQANADGELPLRIGIHVGDVVVQGDDLMGDGINVAARIEAVADAGGIALSRQVYDQVRDRLDIAFLDKGEFELKNIVRPVHVFTVAATVSDVRGRTCPCPARQAFDRRPAVPEHERRSGAGVFRRRHHEDIITALSRFADCSLSPAIRAFPTRAGRPTSGRSAANWRALRTRRKRAESGQPPCASQASWSRPKPETIIGPTVTTASWTRSSTSRTRDRRVAALEPQLRSRKEVMRQPQGYQYLGRVAAAALAECICNPVRRRLATAVSF